MRRITMVAATAAALLLSGCATGSAVEGAASAGELVSGTALVLQGPDDVQPMLCGWGAQPLPPQCVAGVALEGWDWSITEHDASGTGIDATRWGEYRFEVRVDDTVELVDAPMMIGADDRRPSEIDLHSTVIGLLGSRAAGSGCSAYELDDVDLTSPDRSDALVEDAHAAGVPVELLEAQMAFGEVAFQIEQEFPEEFAEAVWTDEGGTIGFSGMQPEGARERLCSLPGVVVQEHLGWTASDPQASIGELWDAGIAAGGEPISAGSSGRDIDVLIEAEPGRWDAVTAALEAVALPEGFSLRLELGAPGSFPRAESSEVLCS